MIRRSSDHSVFSWLYNNYKSFIADEIGGIHMATENKICFEILVQEFDTLFDYTSQEE